MKFIVLALVFQLVISCWPKTNISKVSLVYVVSQYTSVCPNRYQVWSTLGQKKLKFLIPYFSKLVAMKTF